MKNKIFVFILFLLPIMANAQSFKGGFLGSMALTQVEGDSKKGYDKFGLRTGLFVEYRFSERWVSSLGLNYAQRGAYGKPTALPPRTHEYELNLDYLEIPFIVHIMDKDFIYAGLGLSYGTLINSKEVEHSGNVEPLIDTEPFQSWDLAWMADFRLRLYKGLKLNVNYTRSIVPIREREITVNGVTGPADQIPRSINIGLIWIFNENQLRPVDKRQDVDDLK
jgi:hypothetical protein